MLGITEPFVAMGTKVLLRSIVGSVNCGRGTFFYYSRTAGSRHKRGETSKEMRRREAGKFFEEEGGRRGGEGEVKGDRKKEEVNE